MCGAQQRRVGKGCCHAVAEYERGNKSALVGVQAYIGRSDAGRRKSHGDIEGVRRVEAPLRRHFSSRATRSRQICHISRRQFRGPSATFGSSHTKLLHFVIVSPLPLFGVVIYSKCPLISWQAPSCNEAEPVR